MNNKYKYTKEYNRKNIVQINLKFIFYDSYNNLYIFFCQLIFYNFLKKLLLIIKSIKEIYNI